MIVVFEVPDAGVIVTLRVATDGARAVDGDDPRARVRVRADAGRLFALAASPLRFGMPDVATREGRAVVRDLLARRVRVRGLVRRLPEVTTLMRVLSAR